MAHRGSAAGLSLRWELPGGVVLDLLEYAEETDNEVDAVHDEADAHQADKRELLVAEAIPETVGDQRRVAGRDRTGKLRVPCDARLRCAGDE